MERHALTVALLISVVLTLAGCADESPRSDCLDVVEQGGFGLITYAACGGELFVAPYPIIFSGVSPGSSAALTVTVSNLSSRGSLRIEGVRLVEDTLNDPGREEFVRGTEWFSTAQLGPGESRVLEVIYQPNDQMADSGKIELDVTGDDFISGVYEIPIQTAALDPDISTPDLVRFPRVAPVSAATVDQAFRTQKVENIGAAPLSFESIILSGSSDYTIRYYTEDPGMDGMNQGSETWPAELAPGGSFWYRLYFNPDDPLPSTAEVSFFTNDPDEEIFVVDIEGNSDSPCLEFSNEDEINFGQGGIGYANTKTVTIRNCGQSAELEVSNIAITDDGGAVFSVKEDTLPQEIIDGDTLVLEPGEHINFVVTYTPIDETQSTGEITIESNDSSKPSLAVPIVGRGTENQCPTAIAQGSAGGEPWSTDVVVTPQTVVRIDGSRSTDPDGPITRYEWSLVSQPQGSEGIRLLPGADVPNPIISVDAYGVYDVELTVFDDGGLASCNTATLTIHAIPDADFVAMLTWETPGDSDLRDEFGANLDLHFKRSVGVWNTPPDDVFWYNPTADWGVAGPVGDPSMPVVDDNGAGPEIIEVSGLSDGSYAIGVYYFDAAGLGGSTATLRTYLNGTVGPSWTKQLTTSGDFWHVADLAWSPTPSVVGVGSVSNGFP